MRETVAKRNSHKSISEESGAYQEKCDQGCLDKDREIIEISIAKEVIINQAGHGQHGGYHNRNILAGIGRYLKATFHGLLN